MCNLGLPLWMLRLHLLIHIWLLLFFVAYSANQSTD